MNFALLLNGAIQYCIILIKRKRINLIPDELSCFVYPSFVIFSQFFIVIYLAIFTYAFMYLSGVLFRVNIKYQFSKYWVEILICIIKLKLTLVLLCQAGVWETMVW